MVRCNTIIGSGCVVEDNVVLGKQPRRGIHSAATLEPLCLAEAVTVCAGAVVFAGTAIDREVIIGDQSYIRERSRIGAKTVIGRGSTVDNDVVIGQRVRMQTGVYLTAHSLVEDDVFIAPNVTTTNDNTLGNHPPEYRLIGVTLRRGCRIGGGAVLLPGVEVGEAAVVGAGSVVTRNVPPRTVVYGNPARVVRPV